MKIKRITTNIQASDFEKADNFYKSILGLDLLMDLQWIQTYGSNSTMPVQLSVASQGGSDTPVPAISIEVDDLDSALERMKQAGIQIEYGPLSEPWGVRRFYIRDPFDNLINILQHG